MDAQRSEKPRRSPGRIRITQSKHEFSWGEWSLPHFATHPHLAQKEPEIIKGDDGLPKRSHCNCGYIFCESYMGSIAEVNFDDGKGNEADYPPLREAVANAYLIRAAPSLLLAAEEMLEAADLSEKNWAEKIARSDTIKAALVRLRQAAAYAYPPPDSTTAP